MEAENKPQIKDGWTKLDDNYYRQLQVEIFKMRYGNLWFGLLIGFFCGSHCTMGLQIMYLYNYYYSQAVWFFVKWFPLGFGMLLFMISTSVIVYQILVDKKD